MTTNKKSRSGCLSSLFGLLMIPYLLLTHKKTRVVSWAVVLILLGIWGVPKLTDAGVFYHYKEGAYEKVDSKLEKFLAEEDYESAATLMEANEWYMVRDTQIAENILGKSGYNWLPVIDRIDGSTSTSVQEKKNNIYYSLGMTRLKGASSTASAGEIMSKASEGSMAYDTYAGFSKVMDHNALEGGKILYRWSSQRGPAKEDYEITYFHYIDGVEYQNVQDYLEHMLCMAYITAVKPAEDVNAIQAPTMHHAPHTWLHMNPITSDISMYQFTFMDESMIDELTEALKGSTGNQVLALDRVQICGTDEVKLAINGGVMRSLPEQYCAENLDQVGYVLLMDYGYIKEGAWYAGTATARVYDVATGQEIFTSETLEADFLTSYFGEPTNVIFSDYPDITDILREAMSAI